MDRRSFDSSRFMPLLDQGEAVDLGPGRPSVAREASLHLELRKEIGRGPDLAPHLGEERPPLVPGAEYHAVEVRSDLGDRLLLAPHWDRLERREHGYLDTHVAELILAQRGRARVPEGCSDGVVTDVLGEGARRLDAADASVEAASLGQRDERGAGEIEGGALRRRRARAAKLLLDARPR